MLGKFRAQGLNEGSMVLGNTACDIGAFGIRIGFWGAY